jgi:cytoskeletal protein CcmA (bactofilin family)
MKSVRIAVVISVLCLCFLNCKISINSNIYIDDGEVVYSDPMTINGNIFVGSNCEIHGSCRTVNGIIEVGRHSKTRDLQSVNGSIRAAEDVYVMGSLESVNGHIFSDPGVKVKVKVTSINGDIELKKTRVKRDVETYNGHISLLDSTIVYGDVIIKRERHSFERQKPLKITIRDGSVVEGDVIAEREDDNIELHLSGGGRVMGEVKHVLVIEE